MNNEFIDNYIFETEKDKCFKNASEFYDLLLKKYKIKEKKKDLYVRIINYQIDIYGSNLSFKDYYNTYEDLMRIQHNHRCRHYNKLHRKGKRK